MQLLIGEWFTPENDESARFRLRGLTALETLDMLAETRKSATSPDAMTALVDGKIPLSRDLVKIALAGVTAWEGVSDETGRAIEFSPSALAHLDLATTSAIVGRIIDLTFLSKAAEKN